jgi:hypothetical protein
MKIIAYLAPLIAIVLWLVLVDGPASVVCAQEVTEVLIEPAGRIELGPAKLPTREDIKQAEEQLGRIPTFTPPFMPTMDPEEYEAEKAVADREAADPEAADPLKEQEEAESQSFGPIPPLSRPTLRAINFNGIDQTAVTDIGPPPDTHGAVGDSHYVQVVNSRLVVYDKTGTGIQLSNRALSAVLGTSETRVFDPRVVFDRLWKRWVIVATRESASDDDPNQFFFLAVSTTSDPNGDYFVYDVGFRVGSINNGDWWDFPQLGMDQDAVIVTGNIFDKPTITIPKQLSKTTAMIAVAKAALYNGLGIVYEVFTDLAGTLAPPIVLDGNSNVYLVAASNGKGLHLYRGQNLGRDQASLRMQAVVDVDDYKVPPSAPQCNTKLLLDTGDFRFRNASTQLGDSLWNVHTILSNGRARPVIYEIDTEGAGRNKIKRRGILAATRFPLLFRHSFDFNASIVANDFGDVFVTWTSTQRRRSVFLFGTVNCRDAQVLASGFQPNDVLPPALPIAPNIVLFTSSVALTGNPSDPMDKDSLQRWGDYSAVTLDPDSSTTCRQAWIVNETIVNANTWGSRIARIGLCN